MQINEPTKAFFSFALVSFFLFPAFCITAHSQGDVAAFYFLKGKTLLKLKDDVQSIEGVDFEVKKNGNTITKATSGKNGKYSLQLEISTTNPNNDYTIYISKPGTIPKILNINAYVSKEEFARNPFPRYDHDLDITMIGTTAKDIVIEKASGKIKWNDKEDIFDFDQTYAKIIQKEEQKMQTNPDQYLKDLEKKKKKDDEAEAKKKALEDAKLKAEAEAKRLAEQKAKEEADKIIQQNLEAMKLEMKRKRIADSLADLEKKKAIEAANAKMEIKKIVKPVSSDDSDSEYNGTDTYSINIAKKSLSAAKARMNKEKADNLSAKYETNNTLTSLLNMVDEDDKKQKSQANSPQQ